MLVPHDFVLGFIFGVIATLGIAYVVAGAYSRIAKLPSPSGLVYEPPMATALPFIVKSEANEAKTEREFLDAPAGLGR